MARIVVAEVCPQCESLDVRAIEPGWFRVELDRRRELDEGLLEALEFVCRDCSFAWG